MTKTKPRQPADAANAEILFAAELQRQGRLDEAERRYLGILKTRPKDWRALHLLAEIHLARRNYPEALESMAAAMRVSPASTETNCNFGFILQKLDRHDEALTYFNRALVTAPDHVSALLNRGSSLFALNKLTDALANFDSVLALEPNNVNALYNRANILSELRRFDEALTAFAATLAQDPTHPDAHWNEALTRLLIGDFDTGWAKYEWRWATESQKQHRRRFAQALWLGAEPPAGKTVLVHAEQGFGDTLQFVRYIPRLAALGAKTILEAQPGLLPLLSALSGCSQVIARGMPLPPFDLHCPILSLPLAFRTSLHTIPADVPYLAAPSNRMETWRERLPRSGKVRIALAWAGSATHKRDQARSIPLAKLRALFDNNDGVEWLSVQRELRNGDGEILNAYSQVHHLGPELADFGDTAAVLALADLVITVDTAVAHLAGALGRPVWVLLPFCPDFRWLLDRDDSPWYPSARLFRQPRMADWDSVIASLREAIAQFTAARI
ncbi:MAG: tetratricopeptide repeat protein [Pseudolabrys sp.]